MSEVSPLRDPGVPNLTVFVGSSEPEQANKSVSIQQIDREPHSALYTANEQIRILTQRVHQLEQELNNVLRDRTVAAPRLPSLRSMMQPDVMKRYGQLCPTCGQVDGSSSTEKESVRPIGSSISSANSPVSNSTGSETDAWAPTMTTFSPVVGSGAELPTTGTFPMAKILSPGVTQSANETYPMGMTKGQTAITGRMACYECRISGLQVRSINVHS